METPPVKHRRNRWSYTAYQLGQIHRKLDRLIQAIEKLAQEKG